MDSTSTVQNWRAVRRVAVEGNIGSGKSTLLRLLKERSGDCLTVDIVPEPLSEWLGSDSTASTGKENLLEMFYENPTRWAYTFQNYACLSRVRAQIEAPTSHLEGQLNPALLFERSIYSDRVCFGLNSYQAGFLSDMEWRLYCDWLTFITEKLPGLKLDGIIYLRTDPKVCFSRLRQRSRPEERAIELSYLQSLHEKHENWLASTENDPFVPQAFKRFPVIVLDGNEDFEHLPEKQEEILMTLLKFLSKS
ncbi:deoxycytidine kinase 2-like [Oscarella lobularis]|uniref:deoxycytidine kinase 2-like n=1 Tax=Oscarella lobularis TaxID=121494 RepID=UPI0033133CEB